METLPVEMLERIAQHLTPQDLARCSAVSREWREIFNHDWIWQPHCDPELEEPLRTTTCVATPAFVAPDAENSTLSPNSHWKLAFMREKHLWRNWKRVGVMNKEEKIIKSELYVDFLTDTVVVVWYSDKIEILDVSVMPPTLVAKTDYSIESGPYDFVIFSVVGTNMLLVKQWNTTDVFNVDIMNKSIGLKYTTDFYCHFFRYAEASWQVKEDFCLSVDAEGSEFIITNLNTGEILKKEPYPVKNPECVRDITGSTNSDFVAVTLSDCGDDYKYNNIYIYCLKELTFLPGPVAVTPAIWDRHCISLHGHWLALPDGETLKVVNIHTREVLLNYERNIADQGLIVPFECFNGFVFYFEGCPKPWIKHYSPSGRTLTTLYEGSDTVSFDIFHNKFIAIYNYHSEVLESVVKVSDQTVEKCDISERIGCFIKINRSCTKVLNLERLNDCCTSVIHLW